MEKQLSIAQDDLNREKARVQNLQEDRVHLERLKERYRGLRSTSIVAGIGMAIGGALIQYNPWLGWGVLGTDAVLEFEILFIYRK